MTDAQIRKCHERLERFLVDLLEPVGRSERRHWGAVYVRGLLLNGERKSVECRWRRKGVPVWRLRGSHVWGYALASGGRRNREEADRFLSQAGASSVLARGVR